MEPQIFKIMKVQDFSDSKRVVSQRSFFSLEDNENRSLNIIQCRLSLESLLGQIVDLTTINYVFDKTEEGKETSYLPSTKGCRVSFQTLNSDMIGDSCLVQQLNITRTRTQFIQQFEITRSSSFQDSFKSIVLSSRYILLGPFTLSSSSDVTGLRVLDGSLARQQGLMVRRCITTYKIVGPAPRKRLTRRGTCG